MLMMTPLPLFAIWGDHQPRRRLRHKKRGSDIEAEQKVEGRFVDFEKRLRPVDPGIVDQDVETAETGKGGPHRSGVGDIEGQRLRLAAPRAISSATSSS